jgi:Zn-dependent peptidase ImmA (M78 family)
MNFIIYILMRIRILMFVEKMTTRTETEVMANAFASALLLPREGVFKAIPTEEIKSRNVSLATVISLEQYYRVSHQSVLYRLKRLGLITEEALQYMLLHKDL